MGDIQLPSGLASPATSHRPVTALESYNHLAVLSGLSPGTTYYYQAGDASLESYSEIFSFTTPKATATEPLKIAVVGDMGRAQVRC